VHATLIWAFFRYLTIKKVVSFAIAFYLINLLLICNIIFNIGAPMGERLIYHSSLGFSIAIAYFIFEGLTTLKSSLVRKSVLVGTALVLIVLCCFKTVGRNTDWKNDETLFTHDIKVVPNSALVNANVGMYLSVKGGSEQDETLKKDELRKSIVYLDKAISLDENNATSYYNKAISYLLLKEPDSVVVALGSLHRISPTYPQQRQIYYDAGKLLFSQRQFAKARIIFSDLLKAYPNNTELQNALRSVDDSLKTK
jgi:tetratricopeptide (TPR) repeat protein